jgi:hypothetical protein
LRCCSEKTASCGIKEAKNDFVYERLQTLTDNIIFLLVKIFDE